MELIEKKKFLGKSSGEDLETHSRLVAAFAVQFGKLLNPNYFGNEDGEDSFDDFLEILKYAGLLHDISKCTEENQKAIHDKVKLPDSEYTHNEQGWAFLHKHLNLRNEIKNEVLYLIYWHHGIKNIQSKTKSNTIYNTFTEEDISNQLQYLEDVLGSEFICKDGFRKEIFSPKFSEGCNIKDPFRLILKKCFISADRLVSAPMSQSEKENYLSNEESIREYIEGLTNRNNSLEIKQNPYNNERFRIQESVANSDENTILINAPAGFGKTLIPILYASRNQKKIIFVAPRNSIAVSIYNNLLEELNKFGINDISVQLYLTNSVKESNSNSESFLDTDISVTNIDNFLRPTVDNRNAGKLFLLLNCTVVFDEYHEYLHGSNKSSADSLLATFINIMRARHCYTDSKTFLLSATPCIGIEQEWYHPEKKSYYFPKTENNDGYAFFPAAHNKEYNINVIQEPNKKKKNNRIIDENIIEGNNELIITNSVKKAQEHRLEHTSNFLIHSQFEESFKEKNLKTLYENYGKDLSNKKTNENVISTSYVQASHNISFMKLHESVINPSSTIQRIGRINRFGEHDEICELYFYYLDCSEENILRSNMYSYKLSKLWFEYLVGLNKSIFTLDQFYEHYCNFHKKYSSEIKDYMDLCIQNSENVYKELYPKKIEKEAEEYLIIKKNLKPKKNKAGSNKLRLKNRGNEIFFICKRQNENGVEINDGYTDPFSTTIYESLEYDFNEINLTLSSYIERIPDFSNDDRFDYSNFNSKNQKCNILAESKNSTSPFIRKDVVHHPVYGVIKKDLLNKKNKK